MHFIFVQNKIYISHEVICLSRYLSISFEVSNLLAYNCQQYFILILSIWVRSITIKKIALVIYLFGCICVSEYGYVHMNGGRKRTPYPLKLRFQVAVGLLMWVPRPELWSSKSCKGSLPMSQLFHPRATAFDFNYLHIYYVILAGRSFFQ